MRYRVVHKTDYRYSEPASLSQNELFLDPRNTLFQSVEKSDLVIVPDPQYLHSRLDYFGNSVKVFMVQHPHHQLGMTTTSLVETRSPMLPDPQKTASWESVVEILHNHAQPEDLEAYQFVFASPFIAIFREAQDYAEPSFPPGSPVLVGAIDLMRRIFTEFEYEKNTTTVDTTVDQVLTRRKGVCQDFAHLAISCLRSLGLAARYVSGYLNTIPPPGKPKLVGSDASHAWVSLYIPGSGWVDLDPTNNMIPDQSHITVAWGRDYGDVTPVKGVVMGGGRHALSVSVDVKMI